MEMMSKSGQADTRDALESYAGLAMKLQRTFAAQTEALAKLRAAGKQVIEVQHIHVYPGGQAVVGSVHHAGGGGGVLAENTVQPQALAYSPGELAPLPCEDTVRKAMPVASGSREEAVPDARGSARKRRTDGRA
jgi:hypothetical protein